jgi:hypothetical protein
VTHLLGERLRRHADALVAGDRSPLYVELMRAAADDPLVAELFAGDPLLVGSVPALRLLAPLHELVLAGRAPDLARHYPSAGGTAPPAGAWEAARVALAGHADWVRARLERTVQTNEPGRSAVLYAGLQWLALRDARPLRLLEIGASAGLNLIPDRYAYAAGDRVHGDPASPVRFEEPWSVALDAEPHIAARRGCDLDPVDPADPESRRALLSYVWPDELERFERTRAALELAAADPAPVDRAGAADWLGERLAEPHEGLLTVVWHSVVRQYVPVEEWVRVERALAGTCVLSMEPVPTVPRMGPFESSVGRMPTGGHLFMELREGERLLATCGNHGPPLVWV